MCPETRVARVSTTHPRGAGRGAARLVRQLRDRGRESRGVLRGWALPLTLTVEVIGARSAPPFCAPVQRAERRFCRPFDWLRAGEHNPTATGYRTETRR